MASWKTIGIGGGFITNEMLEKKSYDDVIVSIDVSDYDGKPQLVATLKDSNLRVAFNKHSCELMAAKYGDDYHGWLNTSVHIYLDMVKVMGKLTQIKVIAPAASAAAKKRR
ncbi:MAG: hypothetical protein QXW38_09570 [Candidatus Nitrosotenuis sp.]